MNIITSITAQPKQNFIISLDNNETVNINLYYYSSQQALYYDFEYNNYSSYGNKVVLNMNSLRYLRNLIPFGIGFISDTNADPFSLKSFVNQECLMVVWNQEEVQMLEDNIYNVV